jgi:DNA-binding MarR family transcriptional regulator
VIQRQRTTQDGRTYAVSLSTEGRELLEAIKPNARRADRLVLSCLGDEDGKLATRILGRLLRKVDDNPADSAE